MAIQVAIVRYIDIFFQGFIPTPVILDLLESSVFLFCFFCVFFCLKLFLGERGVGGGGVIFPGAIKYRGDSRCLFGKDVL